MSCGSVGLEALHIDQAYISIRLTYQSGSDLHIKKRLVEAQRFCTEKEKQTEENLSILMGTRLTHDIIQRQTQHYISTLSTYVFFYNMHAV